MGKDNNSPTVCRQHNCNVHIMEGKGYCGRHGGSRRQARESREKKPSGNKGNKRRNPYLGNDGKPGVGMGLSRLRAADKEKAIIRARRNWDNCPMLDPSFVAEK